MKERSQNKNIVKNNAKISFTLNVNVLRIHNYYYQC